MPKNNPTHNLYSKPDLQAFRQALSLTSAMYKVKRQVTNHFNDKGRPDSKEQITYVELAITPDGDYRVNQKEQGSWTAENYKISYVYPDYLMVEDIVYHPNYGELRVMSIDDKREYGVSSASAVRVNSIRQIKNSGDWM